MHKPVRFACGLAALMLVAVSAHPTGAPAAPARTAKGAGGFELTVDSIMRGPKLVGYPPTGLRWSGDSSRLYFEWRMAADDEASTWVVARDGGTPRKLTDEERRLAPPVNGRWDKAHRRVLFVDRGDIVLLDTVGGTRRQITRTTGNEANPRWARRESAVKAHALPKFELADRHSVTDLQLSPDGTHVFLLIVERQEAAKRPNVPNYVTESSYTEDISARTFVGDVQDSRSLAAMNIATGKTVTIDAPNAPAGDAKDAKDTKETKDTKTSVRWGMPVLSEDGTLAVAHVRASNNKDRWLAAVDPETGKIRVLDTLHDAAWVREIGGLNAVDTSFGLLPDQHHLWFLSERDGWMHLYSLDANAAQPAARQLTQGKWEVDAVTVSPDKNKFYITSSEAHPGERHIYAMPIDGGERTKLTSMTGGTTGEVSPDEGMFALIYSSSTKPNEVYVMPNRAGASAAQVTTSTSEEWRSFKWIEPQLVTYQTRDGVDVYARMFTPKMVGAKRDPSAAAVVFVHGAGYLQNAHKYWSSYYREYMFHNLLASRGYVVLDPDYRASAGYGRDWRTAIYRHMGGKDLEDVVDGAKFLIEKQTINPKRIGVYGGSYGGLITLMAMFTTPDVFAAGAALRPVTDWTHDNHDYTSSILNEPQADAEAYRKSSPIYFAEGLKGALLICHGMVDTNVLFQDSVRLVQRLIELRKDNWSVAPFPVENHGFEDETSWADEYKRILKLFEDTLKPHDPRRAS